MSEYFGWPDRPAGPAHRVVWLAGIAAVSAGLAGCIALMNAACRLVMGLGGFVAAGGPYVIAHPAPEWVLLVPGCIFAGFAFGGLSIYLSTRMGGFSLVPFVWSGLFVSLGWQFAAMGLHPPQGGGVAWVWIACAVVFIPMGLAPLPGMLRGRIVFKRNFGAGWQTAAPSPWDGRGFRAAYAACVVAGAAAGLAGGLALFRAVAG